MVEKEEKEILAIMNKATQQLLDILPMPVIEGNSPLEVKTAIGEFVAIAVNRDMELIAADYRTLPEWLFFNTESIYIHEVIFAAIEMLVMATSKAIEKVLEAKDVSLIPGNKKII